LPYILYFNKPNSVGIIATSSAYCSSLAFFDARLMIFNQQKKRREPKHIGESKAQSTKPARSSRRLQLQRMDGGSVLGLREKVLELQR
jgi:hypothetical protein